jgi:hypothetical protein
MIGDLQWTSDSINSNFVLDFLVLGPMHGFIGKHEPSIRSAAEDGFLQEQTRKGCSSGRQEIKHSFLKKEQTVHAAAFACHRNDGPKTRSAET